MYGSLASFLVVNFNINKVIRVITKLFAEAKPIEYRGQNMFGRDFACNLRENINERPQFKRYDFTRLPADDETCRPFDNFNRLFKEGYYPTVQGGILSAYRR